jgi:flagellar protein FlaG
MLVETMTGPGKSAVLSSQASLPENQEATKRDGNAEKSVQTLSSAELGELATDVQKNMNIIHNVNLKFSVNKDSGRIMITVTDEATGEVIREIPPSDFVKFADKFDEMVGMIFDKKG